MAFQGGRRARKPETVQDKVIDAVDSSQKYTDVFHHVVGEFTHDVEQSVMDRICAAIILYRLENEKDQELLIEISNNQKLESTKEEQENKELYKDTEYWKILTNKIKNIKGTDITQDIYPLLTQRSKDNDEYCFCPFVRKVFAGETSEFVAYSYPVNSGLELKDEEKKLLIDINNFKCSFMEETLGSLYLKTKIILGDEKKFPDDIKRIFQEKELSNNVNYKEIVGKTDRLGFYTRHSFSNSNVIEPEVWLLINKMGNVDIRKFTLAKVYIHEMMHRYYDMHPELLLKKYVKEIEEPMAEFATIIFCEEFFKNHDEYQELLDVAIGQTESLKNTNDFIYALGADLYNYHYLQSLINDYRHVCMMMDEQNILVSKYSEDVKNNESAFKHEDERAAKNLCDALMNCIKGHRK